MEFETDVRSHKQDEEFEIWWTTIATIDEYLVYLVVIQIGGDG